VGEGEIRSICQELISRETDGKICDAIGFFLYLPGTNTDGLYTAGKATWAPYGDFARQMEVASGDYSKHKLILVAKRFVFPRVGDK